MYYKIYYHENQTFIASPRIWKKKKNHKHYRNDVILYYSGFLGAALETAYNIAQAPTTRSDGKTGTFYVKKKKIYVCKKKKKTL